MTERKTPPTPPPGFVAQEPTPEIIADGERLKYGIIDWAEFWTEEVEERDWLVEGFIQRGQHGVIYSTPGLGKSLLTLELAALLTMGEVTLGKSKVEPINVLYIDQENSKRDVQDRFAKWGFTEDTDLSRLHYSLLGDWPPLNKQEGGDALAKYVAQNEISLVCIDTTSRVVEGDVFHPNTITDLWTHTQMRLKRAGVSVVRIDHAGKNADKGQIGSIMKSADQDMIWKLDRAGSTNNVVIECEKDRSFVIGVGTKVLLRRTENPLRHVIQDATQDAFDLIDEENRIFDALDAAGIPKSAGRPTVEKALRDAGWASLPNSTRLSEIVAMRKSGGVEA